MRAGAASKDSVLVLKANQVDITEIEKVRGLPVRGQVVLGQFESHPYGVVVTFFSIVNRKCEQLSRSVFCVKGIAQVGCKRGDPTTSRKIISHYCDPVGECRPSGYGREWDYLLF
jgi:hypothetical protein